MPCQLYSHKQMHISKLFSSVLYKPFVKSIHKCPQNFRELNLSILPLLKELVRLGHANIVDHSNLIDTRLKKNIKKAQDNTKCYIDA